jgi:hypothetical protein
MVQRQRAMMERRRMGYARGDPLRGHSEALTYWRDAGNAR